MTELVKQGVTIATVQYPHVTAYVGVIVLTTSTGRSMNLTLTKTEKILYVLEVS